MPVFEIRLQNHAREQVVGTTNFCDTVHLLLRAKSDYRINFRGAAGG